MFLELLTICDKPDIFQLTQVRPYKNQLFLINLRHSQRKSRFLGQANYDYF